MVGLDKTKDASEFGEVGLSYTESAEGEVVENERSCLGSFYGLAVKTVKQKNRKKKRKLECLQRHEGVPVRPTPRCSP